MPKPFAPNHLPAHRALGLRSWAATAATAAGALLMSIALTGCGSPAPTAASADGKPAAPVSAIHRPMMLPAPVWATTTMAVPKAAAKDSAAYKMDGCKGVDGWQIAIGTCTSNGSFSGVGAGSHLGLLYMGRFTNGLPDGDGSLCLMSTGFWDDYQAGVKSCNGRLACNVRFKAGRLEGDTLQCRIASLRGEPEVLLQLRSASGFRIDDGLSQIKSDGFNGPKSTITADLAEVDLRNHAKWGLVYFGRNRPLSRATGKARQVQLSAQGLQLSRLEGTLTVRVASDALDRATDESELEVQGVMDAHGDDWFTFLPAGYDWQVGSPVPREGLLNLRHMGVAYQLVFMPSNHLPQFRDTRAFPKSVLYYKDSQGIEFDGTADVCWGKGSSGSADLSVQSEGREWRYGLEPRCGTMTTPTGSYTGRFRNGRPQ